MVAVTTMAMAARVSHAMTMDQWDFDPNLYDMKLSKLQS
jgi:hypothetical protein